MSKIIAIDFDGTLCQNQFPNIGKPNYNVIIKLKAEKFRGSRIILWTCRNGKQLQEAIDWCNMYDIHFDAINENLPDIIDYFGGDTRKVVADEYWDDRAINTNTFF